jgi:hypothetical protein
MWGHDVAFFVPLDHLGKIDIDEQDDIAEEVKTKLNKCAHGIGNEYFHRVRFEMLDDNDAECQKATAFSTTPPIDPSTLDFWKPGLARVFISHRDSQKVAARALGEALSQYGMACFVAHDTIKPMKTWRSEILNGLQTMEVMLVFLTDDFEDSLYCHQEVGYALGRGIPIISLKLGKKDPPGFISEIQAARGRLNSPIEAARLVFPLISNALGRSERLQEVLVSNFAASPSWTEAKARFDHMASAVSELTQLQAEQLVKAFRENDQLHNSTYLTSDFARLKKFMGRATGKEWSINGKSLTVTSVATPDPDLDDDVPF